MKAKTLKIIYWVITIGFFGFLTMGAVFELMQDPSAQDLLKSLSYPVYVNYIIGTAKIIGFISIIQWKFKALKEWAYAGFTIDIIGAGSSFYFAGMGIGSALGTLSFLIPLFLSYYLWKKTDAKS